VIFENANPFLVFALQFDKIFESWRKAVTIK